MEEAAQAGMLVATTPAGYKPAPNKREREGVSVKESFLMMVEGWGLLAIWMAGSIPRCGGRLPTDC